METLTRPINNKLPRDIRELLQKEIIRLNEQDIIISIKKARGKVTLNQFRYYYAVVVQYWCEFTGYAPDQMDVILKSEFAKFQGWIDGNGFVIIPSKSRDFDTKIQEDFNVYCRNKYYDLTGGVIPLPGETIYNY